MIRALFWDRSLPTQPEQNHREVDFNNRLDNGRAILDGRHQVKGTHHQKIIGVIPHQSISTDFGHGASLPEAREKLFLPALVRGIPNAHQRVRLFCPVREPTYEGSKYQYVHSKVFVFDDKFCTIGSMNVNYRGTTHDSEIVVGIYEAPETKGGAIAKRLRTRLWARHLKLDVTDKRFDKLETALACE